MIPKETIDHERTRIVITIPAKNESQYILKTLGSIRDQVFNDHFVNVNYFKIIILCNHCTDDTNLLCQNFKKENGHLDIEIHQSSSPLINNIGKARKFLMDRACQVLTRNSDFILMTDADTRLEKNLFSRLSLYHEQKIEMVCGRISVESTHLLKEVDELLKAKMTYEDLRLKLESTWLPIDHDPWPKHASNSGPCMAIKRGAYTMVGGISEIGYFEDIDLYNRLLLYGLKIRHDPQIVVTTSGRLNSRVDMGFGNELRYWTLNSVNQENYMVDGLEKLNLKYSCFSLLRKMSDRDTHEFVPEVSEILGLSNDILINLLSLHRPWQSLMITIEELLINNNLWITSVPKIKIDKANAELSGYFKTIKGH